MGAVVGFEPYVDISGVAYTVVSLDIGSQKLMLSFYRRDERSGNQNIECLAYDGLVDGITQRYV